MNMKKIIAIAFVFMLVISSFLIILLNGRENNGAIALPTLPTDIQASEYIFDPQDPLTNVRHLVTPLSIDEALSYEEPRGGYILAPTLFGSSGIDSLSSFVLRTPNDYGASTPVVHIDGQEEPTISRHDDQTFMLTPVVPLTSNSVYLFRLIGDDEEEITWAFQTAPLFEIASTLPRHQSTNVPVATGIEISFSFGEVLNIADYFRIYPHVDGEFIHRDSTAIFMPESPLLEGQIYRVTINSGIHLPNTSHIITTDYVFSFETTADAATMQNQGNIVHFNTQMVEFPSFAEPSVGFWLNYDRNNNRPSFDMNVYQIGELSDAIHAYHQLMNVPYWSSVSWSNRIIDTSDLRRISSTRINERQGPNDWNEVFTLPNVLPPGFYVLSATSGDASSQMLIQITDLAVQTIADEHKTLLWVNDMNTGAPVSGARVYDPITEEAVNTNAQGIAVVKRMLSTGEYLIITTDDGRECVVFSGFVEIQPFPRSEPVFHDGWFDWGWPGMSHHSHSDYWTALQLDRTLFQRNDTLSFWGFVQPRSFDETITHVSAVLTEHGWWHEPERDALHRQNIAVRDGAYTGEIRLPHLNPGSYELAIYHGDVLLSSTFFSVMDYVTPPYRLTVSTSQNAVFAGEEVLFTARTEFFEGTPVADLDIFYDMWSDDLGANESRHVQTNQDGVFEVSARPYATNNRVSGERSLRFWAEATLPEMGWTHQSAEVRVFVNDIHMDSRGTRSGEDATLTVDVHSITLDRLNDGTSEHWRDFLDAPMPEQNISVEIMEIYWEAIREGQRYDHVTRQVIPRYRYEQRERSVDSFEITTDRNGHVTIDFQVPNQDLASYKAILTTVDGNGRTKTQEVFIGRDFTWFFWSAEDDGLFLDGAIEDGYQIGDQVKLSIMQGADLVTRGNFLFVVVQNGIMSYHIGTNPLSFTFGEQHVPNVQVHAFHFNGHTYQGGWNMSERIRFNPAGQELEISVSTCEDSYGPGDEVTIRVTTKDKEGNPKASNVNISLVDEALFALMDVEVDTFAMLYGNVDDHLMLNTTTHRTFVSDGIIGRGEVGESFAFFGNDSVVPVPESEIAVADDAGGVSAPREATIRERFEDTAVFASFRTNNRGVGSFTFRLPDNITSWRVTASAISTDLYAGNMIQSLPVTQPMFLHYTLNNTFLVGDTPYVGVSAYGSSLLGGEEVLFEVWNPENPSDIHSATGVSFERVNIPLPEMDGEGHFELVVQASVGNYSDAVLHTYQVFHSYRLVERASFYEVTEDTEFNLPSTGLSNITFMDFGRGRFLNDLISMNFIWQNGARIEGFIAQREATRLIETHFPEVPLFNELAAFDILEYQRDCGGIAILPYSDADLETTVMLLPFILHDVNLVALRDYLYEIYHTSEIENRIHALYGLALLGEPVLMDLREYALLSDLSVRNAAYVALGLVTLGEVHEASQLYRRFIEPHIQAIAPYYRVEFSEHRDAILKDTSIVALLATQLDLPESIGLHEYATRDWVSDPLLNVQRLAFITHEMNAHTHQEASITYTLFGETITRDLGHGGQFNLRIPVGNIREFELVSITGEVGAVSIVQAPLEEHNVIENDISIRRQFFLAGTNTSSTTFEQGDLVRIQISIDYPSSALTGSYVITDFLPAGLTFVSDSARFGDMESTPGWWAHATSEGQRVTFFDFNGRYCLGHTYYYYARVVNPGTFLAEGTLVQSFGARQYLTLGEDARIVINP